MLHIKVKIILRAHSGIMLKSGNVNLKLKRLEIMLKIMMVNGQIFINLKDLKDGRRKKDIEEASTGVNNGIREIRISLRRLRLLWKKRKMKMLMRSIRMHLKLKKRIAINGERMKIQMKNGMRNGVRIIAQTKNKSGVINGK